MPAEERIAWAITGPYGMYYCLSATRAQAIAEHVAAYNEKCSEFVWGGKLDDRQREEWKRRKAAGDRAIKVKVTPI